jgi:hypothetical protein
LEALGTSNAKVVETSHLESALSIKVHSPSFSHIFHFLVPFHSSISFGGNKSVTSGIRAHGWDTYENSVRNDLERSSFGPLGKGLAVDCYALESSSPSPLGKDLLACSKKRDAVDAAEAAGDVAVQELGIFRKLLDIFEKWLL